MRISNIDDLEKKIAKYKKVAIFPAGEFGKSWAYDIVNSAGEQGIYCYYDNRLEPGIVIRDGIKVNPIEELYSDSSILVILAVGLNLQKILLEQLEQHSINNIVLADEVFLTQIGQSIENCGEDKKEQYCTFWDNRLYLTNLYFINHHNSLNIDTPETFNDKLNWLKLNYIRHEYSRLADKYEVKEYVRNIIGADYIIPTITVADSWEDLDFDSLPSQFVIKCTHDSGSTFIINDKKQLADEKIKNTLTERMKVNPYYFTREYVYKDIKPRLIVEELVVNEDGDIDKNISDYKFFCYDGVPRYVFVLTGREKGHNGMRIDFFDDEFHHIPDSHKSYPNAEIVPEKPINFDDMKELVRKLAKGIRFVRIDMYSVGNKIYFGEYTFFPGGGMEGYPDILGKYIKVGEE